MIKHEAKFTTKFKKWMKLRAISPSCGAYEIKVTPNNRIRFDAVQPHQIDALKAVKHGKFIYKIPDAGFQNPFDLLSMVGQPAYVVFAWLEQGKKAHTFIIDIDLFEKMKEEAEDFGVKSASQDFMKNYHRDYPERCQYHII